MTTNQPIYLKDYKAPNIIVNSMSLDFELYEDYVWVRNVMDIQPLNDEPIILNGDELILKGIKLNGAVLSKADYQLDSAGNLQLPPISKPFRLEIWTEIYPQHNTHLSGLYRSHDLFCTQCEAEGFRRITYFFDRPDVLTIYTTRISADKAQYPILLSNGNRVEAGHLPNGRHYAVWHDPFKKPSYLFALVVGQLSVVTDRFITMTGRAIDLHIYVEPGNEKKCDHAMDSLKRAMKWDEEEYGREYDLDIFMIVAVSDFNMGAMENKGLNIFNAKYILAQKNTATDQDYADIEGIVAHEYFHNWTGNRITCRDWFQLSLKEGLTVFRDQEFSRDMNSKEVCRIQDVNLLRAFQFPEDAGAMAHPVQPSAYEEINNFYTATVYNKGAEVIRMQRVLLGADGFRKGMDLYFHRYDGQAITIDDFIAAMSDANGVNLSQFKRWYTQAGTPVVTVLQEYHDGKLTLHLEQSCPASPGQEEKLPFHIPLQIAFFNNEGKKLTHLPPCIELKESHQSFEFHTGEPVVVSLLREFSAPIRLIHSYDEAQQLHLLRYEDDGFAKWEAAQSVALSYILKHMHVTDEPLNLSSAYVEALKASLLDDTQDEALKALLLSPPGFEQVLALVQEADVERIEAARKSYRQALGQALWTELVATYERLCQAEVGAMNGTAYAQRALKNTTLFLLMKTDENQAIHWAKRQFEMSQTMTDQIASFNLLVNIQDESIRHAIIEKFLTQWQSNELVMDKWFSAQAMCEHDGALIQVQKLMKHPLFSLKNPNKVRALIGAFCHGNPSAFHHPNGSGYQFLKEVLLALDGLNPQIAARSAIPFSKAKQLNPPRQVLIQNILQELSSKDLSKDLREIVDKSLLAFTG